MVFKLFMSKEAPEAAEATAKEQASKKQFFNFERGDELDDTTPFSGKGKPLDALRAHVTDSSDHGDLFSKDGAHGSNNNQEDFTSDTGDHGSNSNRNSLFSNDNDHNSTFSNESDYDSNSDRKMYGERDVAKGDDDTSIDDAGHSRSVGNDGNDSSVNGSSDEHSKSVGNDDGGKREDSKEVKENSNEKEKKKPIWTRAWESVKDYLKQNYLSEVQQNLQNFVNKMDSSIDNMLGSSGGSSGGGNNAYGMPEQMARHAWKAFKRETPEKPTARPDLKKSIVKPKEPEVTKETIATNEEHKIKRQREDDDETAEENRVKRPKLTEIPA